MPRRPPESSTPGERPHPVPTWVKTPLVPALPLSTPDLARVLSSLEPCGLPRAAYTEEAVLAFEREPSSRGLWSCVGREQELAAPGDFLRARVAGEELLVVRGVDLELRAFYNVCRHRGLLLLEAERGRAQELTCGYHGWVYEPSGALRLRAVHAAQLSSRVPWARARCGWECGTASCSSAWIPKRPRWQKPCAAPRLGSPGPSLRTCGWGARSVRTSLPTGSFSSKIFKNPTIFRQVHPALEQQTPSATAVSWSGAGLWLGGLMELSPGVRTVATPGGAERPFIVAEPERGPCRRRAGLAFAADQPTTRLFAHLPPGAARGRSHARDRQHLLSRRRLRARAARRRTSRLLGSGQRRGSRDLRGAAAGARVAQLSSSRVFVVEEGTHAFDRWVARRYLEAMS